MRSWTGGAGGDPDAEQRAAWDRARVLAARRHHPDLGGDPTAYLEAMAEVDSRYTPRAEPGTGRVEMHRSRSAAARLARAAVRGRRSLRRLQGTLPRRLRPGRRYTDL